MMRKAASTFILTGIMILFLSIGAQGQTLGDLNCDGVVNESDCGPFILAMTDSDEYALQYPDCNFMNADMNLDSFILCDDWHLFQQALGHPLPPCANIPCPLLTTSAAVPTLSEWSRIILMIILGMVSIYYLKRLRRRRSG